MSKETAKSFVLGMIRDGKMLAEQKLEDVTFEEVKEIINELITGDAHNSTVAEIMTSILIMIIILNMTDEKIYSQVTQILNMLQAEKDRRIISPH